MRDRARSVRENSGPGPACRRGNERRSRPRGHLTVTLCLESGETFPTVVDTGTAVTLLPKSLERRLGQRFRTTTFENFGNRQRIGIYAAPKLFLGNTLLDTGNRVGTCEDPSGILSTDCLRHYCIQMDFQTGTLRFCDSAHLNTADLGKAFPLTDSAYTYIQSAGLLQDKAAALLVDTGHPLDGMVEPRPFLQQARQQAAEAIPVAKDGVVTHKDPGLARFPNCVWNGNSYTNLLLGKGRPNLIGLMFLARHLVTFDLPGRTMYLKQTSVSPLVDEQLEGAFNCLKDLKAKGQLPGWPKSEPGTMMLENHPDREIYQFAARRPGDSSTCHFQVTRASKDSPWKLEKAWLTDANGHQVMEYPVPQEPQPR